MFDIRTSRGGRFRPILTVVLVVVVLVLGWVGLEVYFAATLKPSVDINYGAQVRELVGAMQQSDDEDVWPDLIGAIEIHEELLNGFESEDGDTWRSLGYRYGIITDFNDAHQRASDEFYSGDVPWESQIQKLELAEQWAIEAIRSFDDAGITDLMDKVAAGRVALRPVPDSNEVDELIEMGDYGSQSRNLARGFCAAMFRASERGDWKTYTHSMEHGLAIGRIWMMQPGLTARLGGLAIRGMFETQLQYDMASKNIPPSVMADVRDVYLRQSLVPGMSYTLATERLISLDMAQRFYSSSGRYIHTEFSDGATEGTSLHWIHNARSGMSPRWQATEREINDAFDDLTARLVLKRWERNKAFVYEPLDFQGMLQSMSNENQSVVDLLTMAWGFIRNGDSLDSQDALSDGIKQMLAIEVYVYENGAYPTALTDLVPEYFDQLPADVYTSDGSPWQYRLKTNPSRQKTAYLLYSIGIDGTDNDGTVPVGEHPASALQNNSFGSDPTGTDYVVTQPFRHE